MTMDLLLKADATQVLDAADASCDDDAIDRMYSPESYSNPDCCCCGIDAPADEKEVTAAR
jgi:hypothetical protein